MSAAKFLATKPGQYAVIGVVGVIAAVLLYKFVKGEAKQAAQAVGGLVTGNNAMTQGTAYEGAGVAGTLGATVDAAGGGIFSRFGSWIGGTVYDMTHDEADLTAPTIVRQQPSHTSIFDDSYSGDGYLN